MRLKGYAVLAVLALATLSHTNKNTEKNRPEPKHPAIVAEPIEWGTIEIPEVYTVPEATTAVVEEITPTVEEPAEVHYVEPAEITEVDPVEEYVEPNEIPGVEGIDLTPDPILRAQAAEAEPVMYDDEVLVNIMVDEDREALLHRTLACLQYCPYNLKKNYFDNGYVVNIVDRSVTDAQDCIGYIEITEDGPSEIFVSAAGYCIEAALLHEFGHYLDHICGRPSESDYFTELMLTEGVDAGLSEYHTTHAREYFAEIFQELMYNPNGTIIKNCPQSAAFVKMYVDAI